MSKHLCAWPGRSRVPSIAECKISKRESIVLLEASSVDRVPELVSVRYGRMLENPFSYY
jgi:hypothetical protein